MTLTEYLQSEQARSEMQQAIEHGVADAPGRMLSTGTIGAWSVTQATVNGASAAVHYRPEGDRYIVTDLGEGVRALRLKGCGLLEISDKVRDVLAKLWVAANDEDKMRTPFELSRSEIGYPTPIGAANLPDALCRVMLASLRVAEMSP